MVFAQIYDLQTIFCIIEIQEGVFEYETWAWFIFLMVIANAYYLFLVSCSSPVLPFCVLYPL